MSEDKDADMKALERMYEGLESADTRILDRGLGLEKAFDGWLWKHVALNPDGCLSVKKVIYGSAGDLECSAVTTRRYLLERVFAKDPVYSIISGNVIWNGYRRV